MIKPNLLAAIRKAGLMHPFDEIKFLYQKTGNKKKNTHFLKENPSVVLPPDYLMFESFQLDYRKYYEGGRQSANWVLKNISEYINPEKQNILDWGCGPARIVRHIPELTGNTENIYATDYNPETIKWCQRNIRNVKFSINGTAPPLPFSDNFFGIIYGISIFTHISEIRHKLWFNELARVSKKGGIILLTTQGEIFREKLIKKEIKKFDSGELVVRGGVKEGHRVYSTFHPPSYMRELFASKAKILRHKPGEKMDWGMEQDLWILKIL